VTELRADLDGWAPERMDQAVMRRITELGLEPVPSGVVVSIRRGVSSLFATREVRVRWRPVYGVAAAAVVAALVLVPTLGRRFLSRSPAEASSPAATVYVQFRLLAGDAQNVALAGSFSDWQPDVALRPSPDGIWTVTVPLPPGVHDYAFIVDGQRWVPDPYAPQVDDGFGGTHSRLMLLPPQS
jgi:hypothetical protein